MFEEVYIIVTMCLCLCVCVCVCVCVMNSAARMVLTSSALVSKGILCSRSCVGVVQCKSGDLLTCSFHCADVRVCVVR